MPKGMSLLSGFLKGSAQAKMLGRDREEQKELNSLKKMMMQIQLSNAKTKQQQLKMVESLLQRKYQKDDEQKQTADDFDPLSRGTQGATEGADKGKLIESLAGGDIFGGDMSPQDMALFKSITDIDFLGAGRLRESQERGDVLERNSGRRIQQTQTKLDRDLEEIVWKETRTEQGTFEVPYNKYGMPMGGVQPRFKSPRKSSMTPETVSPATRNELALTEHTHSILDELVKTYKKEYVGIPGIGKKIGIKASAFSKGLGEPGFATWSMALNRLKALYRHELFGSAFTATEKAAFKALFASEYKGAHIFLPQLKKVLEMVGAKYNTMAEMATKPVLDIKSKRLGKPDYRFNPETGTLEPVQ